MFITRAVTAIAAALITAVLACSSSGPTCCYVSTTYCTCGCPDVTVTATGGTCTATTMGGTGMAGTVVDDCDKLTPCAGGSGSGS
jgi:hypothetical protein